MDSKLRLVVTWMNLETKLKIASYILDGPVCCWRRVAGWHSSCPHHGTILTFGILKIYFIIGDLINLKAWPKNHCLKSVISSHFYFRFRNVGCALGKTSSLKIHEISFVFRIDFLWPLPFERKCHYGRRHLSMENILPSPQFSTVSGFPSRLKFTGCN